MHLRFITLVLLSYVLFPPVGGGVVMALDPRKAISQYPLAIWQTENGLPQNTIRAITQTHDGYLWIGTDNGLARFDGVRFTVFTKRTNKDLAQDAISALYQDEEGTLWIGTIGGLFQYKSGKFSNVITGNSPLHEYVTSICESRDHTLWVGTWGGGLHQFRDGKLSTYTTKDGLPSNQLRGIYEDHQRNLWVGTPKGLAKFKDGKFTTYTKQDGLPSTSIRTVYEDHTGLLWVLTFDSGLAQYSQDKFTIFTAKNGRTLDNVTRILEDSEGNLWFGTSGAGIARLTAGELTSYTTHEGLPSDKILALYEDHEGDLWVGTEMGGLIELRDGKFTNYGTKEGLSSDLTTSVFEARDGSLWIGTNGGGVNQLKDGKFFAFTTRDGLSNNLVTAIRDSRDGSLWLGSDLGLSRFRNGKFLTYTSKDGMAAGPVRALYEDRAGDLWIGTQSGLSLFKDGKFKTYTTQDGLGSNFVRAICESRDGSLWIGTGGGGLTRFKDGKFIIYTTKDGLASGYITRIYEDREGVIWVGTVGGGLNRFKDGRFIAFTTAQGLLDDTIGQILEDDSNNLWMGSGLGIFRVSKQDLNDYADGKVKKITSIAYSTADGMRSSACGFSWDPPGWRTKDGRLWFPTDKGISVIDPHNIKTNQLTPPVFIEQVIIDKKALALDQNAQLPAGKGELDVSYAGLSYVAPLLVKFKYKLEGFDEDWIEAGTQRVAHYTNLPAGAYRFRVIACNNDGVWNETGAAFSFYLQPHFYQTKWFYALCVLVAMLVGFGLYRLRVKQLRRRTLELEETVDQRTAELKREQQKVLRLEKQSTEQQMAGGFAHEMRNALAGSKLILDQALALDDPEPRVSLSLANCRNLKEIYLGVKGKLPADETQFVLGKMQTIFANEERLDEVMQLVRKATSRGLNITQQIMDYSKMGQQQPGQQRVDLPDLIENIVNELRDEFSSQGVVVDYQRPMQQLAIIGDETHFYSIFQNIILNGRDALTDPSVKDRRDRRIEITTALEGGTCSVVVADNGVGIVQENLQKVFEPFFSTKPATGTGLGLGMVMKMVSLYGGAIAVSSEVGYGTSVTISLPLSQQAETV